MAGRRGAQFGDIEHFGEVHFEDCAFPISERNRVLHSLPGFGQSACRDLLYGLFDALHVLVVAIEQSRRHEFVRRVIAMRGGEALLDLNATAMAVHIAEATNVHKDVEAEALSGAEVAEEFIVSAAMTQSKID